MTQRRLAVFSLFLSLFLSTARAETSDTERKDSYTQLLNTISSGSTSTTDTSGSTSTTDTSAASTAPPISASASEAETQGHYCDTLNKACADKLMNIGSPTSAAGVGPVNPNDVMAQRKKAEARGKYLLQRIEAGGPVTRKEYNEVMEELEQTRMQVAVVAAQEQRRQEIARQEIAQETMLALLAMQQENRLERLLPVLIGLLNPDGDDMSKMMMMFLSQGNGNNNDSMSMLPLMMGGF